MAREVSDPEVIKALKDMKTLIVQNTSTSLREPDLYFGQDLMKQTCEVTGRYSETPLGITHWLEDTCKDIINEGASNIVENLMNKILNEIRDEIKNVPFIMLNDHHVAKIQHFIRTPTLAKLFVLYNFPKGKSVTKIGKILGGLVPTYQVLFARTAHF